MSMHPYRYYAAALNELIGRTAAPFTIELLTPADASIRLDAVLTGQALPSALQADILELRKHSGRAAMYWVGDRHCLGYVLVIVNDEDGSPQYGEVIRAWAFPV